MKKLVLTVALLSFSGMANAFGDNDASANAGAIAAAKAKASATSIVRNRNSNRQHQGQLQGQLQGQGQGQLQGNVGLGSGNETIISNDYDEVKQDIPAFAPDAIASPATAPCIVTWAGSAGGLGLFSAGVSGYIKDHVCALGEVARRAQAQGDMVTAQKALDLMFEMTLREAGLVEGPVQEVAMVEQPIPSLTSEPELISSGAWQH